VLFGLLTYLTNLYFKIKEERLKAARGEYSVVDIILTGC
ncbi:class II holin family protein, partial [Escherichia coli]